MGHEFRPDAVMHLTNTISIGVQFIEFDFIRYAFLVEGDYVTPLTAPIKYNEYGEPYFISEGDVTYNLSEFLKINM